MQATGRRLPHCTISMFDVNSQFTKIYQNPKQYGFDPTKLKTPFTSLNLDKNDPRISDSEGFMFFDITGHPTAQMQNILADAIHQELLSRYDFLTPRKHRSHKKVDEHSMVTSFYRHYNEQLTKDRKHFFGSKSVGLQQDHSLRTILYHALHEKGQEQHKR